MTNTLNPLKFALPEPIIFDDDGNIFHNYAFGVRFKDKFAPVAPFHLYQQFLLNGYVPSTVLLLAHDVVEHAVEYQELFDDPKWDNTTIFMDNSLVELKKAVDIEMVKDAVDIIGRKQIVVILPDVMGESEPTTKSTLDAWDKWSREFRDHQKLVVIQGASIQEWLKCAESLAHLKPDWVSIPRVTENAFGYHRWELVPFIEALYPESKIHLLGFSDYIWEDLKAAACESVKSIDSAVPLRMKTMNILSEVVEPRGNWWEEAKFDISIIERCRKINDLIRGM